MVATIHRNPFEILIRKIGYSVGLEYTRERVKDLVEEYAKSKSITPSQWSYLVKDRWGLKTDNILQVFSSLSLLNITSGSASILFGLDSLAILRILLTDEDFERALEPVLTFLIIAADADVFLNCLAAEFDDDRVRDLLVAMVESKRSDAHKVIKLSALRQKVDKIINIETQKSNKGSASSGLGLGALKRTDVIDKKSGPLDSGRSQFIPHISDDYMRKVPGRRRDWARSLGLFEYDELTLRGAALLKAMRDLGCRYPDGSYSLWPFEPELSRLHLTRDTAPWPTVSFARLVSVLVGVFGGEDGGDEPFDPAIFRQMFAEYKHLNSQKAILRNELPLRVALLVHLGLSVVARARGSVDNLVMDVNKKKVAGLEHRASRNHEGSLVFKEL